MASYSVSASLVQGQITQLHKHNTQDEVSIAVFCMGRGTLPAGSLALNPARMHSHVSIQLCNLQVHTWKESCQLSSILHIRFCCEPMQEASESATKAVAKHYSSRKIKYWAICPEEEKLSPPPQLFLLLLIEFISCLSPPYWGIQSSLQR